MSARIASVVVALLALSGVGGAAHAGNDFDGDHRADVFWRNTLTGVNTLWLGANAASQRAITRVADLHWTVVGEGDFDGDGRSDLLWRNLGTGANVIWRAADASLQIAMPGVSDLRWQVAGVADFDGDGRADVLWRHAGTGANVIWRSGNAMTSRTLTPVATLHWIVAGTGDFDGDRRADVFWRNLDTGANVLWHSADASRAQTLASVADAHWQVAAIGDFDGDGAADVFWRNLESGRNALWRRANAASQISVPVVGSLAWQVIESGDFDGDGRADLLWREFVLGTNVIWRGGNPSSPMGVVGVRNLDWAVVPFEAQATQPFLSIDAQVTVVEGNNGNHAAPFAIHLSHPSVVPVVYRYDVHDNELAVAGGATSATAGSDYVAANAERTFAPGQLSDTVAVTVVGDTTPEPHEAFDVVPYEATGAQLLWIDGIGVIRNDDGTTLWLQDARVVEGNSGQRPMTFTIWLSAPATGPVRINAATAPLPPGVFAATPGQDYISKQAVLTIPAGAISTTFTVEIIGDTIREPIGEDFLVNLADVQGGALIVTPQARGYIVDDEPPIIP